jgi:hypothetical protein
MAALNIESNLASPDEFYAALLDAHRGLDMAQSEGVNARLILILANHIGDLDVLREALRRARQGVDEPPVDASSSTVSVSPLKKEGDS